MKLMRNDPDMLEEYDFSGGVRGKYASKYKEGTNIVGFLEKFPLKNQIK